MGHVAALASLSRCRSGPFGSDLLETSEQELPKAPGLLDLAEDGLDGLFSEPVA